MNNKLDMNNSLPDDERLKQEAAAFDNQIKDRISAGHIPDLRRAKECEYFYNNSWRHPEYVKLDFYEQFSLILNAINQYSPNLGKRANVLEVGCGPGYIALELSRNGINVTGIDISEKCIQVARKFAEEDPWKHERGNLEYRVDNFFTSQHLEEGNFDAIYFVGALHHFSNQTAVLRQCKELLVKDGILIALEPTRDRVMEGNAAIVHLIQSLLSVAGGYYKNSKIPESLKVQEDEIKDIYMNLRYENESGEKLQSINDNEAGYAEMLEGFESYFDKIELKDLYGFFHELIGGLRFDQEVNNQLARYLRDMDRELCKMGVIQATEFLYVGKAKA